MNTFLLQIVIYWWLQRTSLEVAIWNCQEETALESSSSSLIALLSLSRSLSSYWTTNNVRSTFLNSCSYLLLLGRYLYLGVYTTSWILMANPTTIIIISLHKPAFLLSKMIAKNCIHHFNRNFFKVGTPSDAVTTGCSPFSILLW